MTAGGSVEGASGSEIPDGAFSPAFACSLAGVSTRQIGYWRRSGLLVPSARDAFGRERYSARDVLVLRAIGRLVDRGVTLSAIRAAMAAGGAR